MARGLTMGIPGGKGSTAPLSGLIDSLRLMELAKATLRHDATCSR
jgi:hypothetical protein